MRIGKLKIRWNKRSWITVSSTKFYWKGLKVWIDGTKVKVIKISN